MANSIFISPQQNETVTNIIISGTGYFADGSAAAPSRTYTLDTDLGSYRIGANNEGFAAGGALIFDYNASRILSAVPILGPDGSLSATSYGFGNSATSGMNWIPGSTELGFAVSGNYYLGVRASEIAIRQTSLLGWPAADNITSAFDLSLSRLAAGQLKLLKDSTHGVAFDANTDGTLLLLTRAGAADVAAFTAGGNITTTNGALVASAAGTIKWTSRSGLTSPSDGVVAFLNNASTAGVQASFGTDGTIQFLSRAGADSAIVKAAQFTSGSATLVTTATALTNGAGAQAATILNGPTAGNPTKWVPINDNGTTRYIPAW